MAGANDLCHAAIELLNKSGHFAWRQNNLAVRGRAFRGKLGVPDILCVCKGGKFLGVEIKIGKDTASEHQTKFHEDVIRRGGHCIFIKSIDDLIEYLRRPEYPV